MAEWRNAGFLGAAIVLHAILVAVLPFVRRHHVAPPPPPPVEIEVEETTTAARAGDVGMAGHVNARVTVVVKERGQGHGQGQGQVGEVRVEEAAGVSEAAQPEASAEAMPSLMMPQSIGLEGPGSFRMQIAKDLPTDQQILNETTRHAIVDPLRAHDAMNGTLTSGPVAQELERTTRRLEGTPFQGRAVFSVDVDELGLVVNVGVSEASGSKAAWDEVARAVLNAFAQKRLHVPHGAKRVALQIEISSKVTLPSGGEHPMSVDSPAVQGLAHAAQGQFDRPADSPSIVSGSFDISDIGAHPARVVGARVLSEQTF